MDLFNDVMDVHEARMKVDREVLALFWNPLNEQETIADLKRFLRERYEHLGNSVLLADAEKRAADFFSNRPENTSDNMPKTTSDKRTLSE